MKFKNKINFYLTILIPEFIIKFFLINYSYKLFYSYFLRTIKKKAKKALEINLYSRLNQIIPTSDNINDISNDEKNSLIINADNILNGKYCFLGVNNIDFKNINWHKDYISSFEWKPGKYYK